MVIDRKIIFLFYSILCFSLVFASSQIDSYFAVSQDDMAIENYSPPFLHYLYNFIFVVVAVLLVIFLFKIRFFSSLFGKKKISKTKGNVSDLKKIKKTKKTKKKSSFRRK
jgi:hypothetical protein